ncbi:MAG: phosphotransferase [Actinomycetota bacterium]|nr:phosphotransferase [Actinomycetota bacterium]
MTDNVQTPASELRHFLDIEALKEWIENQRWYASKSRRISSIEIDESVVLSEAPMMLLALVQAVFATGQHELYQLPLGFRREGDDSGPEAIAVAEGWSVYDALAEPDQARELLRRIDASEDLETPEGCLRFRRADGPVAVPEDASVRPVGVEQSNSSLVFGDELVLKVFRKLEPGINPELEMLRFLTAREFPSIAPLRGWYEYDGRSFAATLGVAQEFLPDAKDGWELALNRIAEDPEGFLEQLGSLGTVTAEMHSVLASDASDPAFAPEEPSHEALSLLTATIDEDIARIFARLPEDERLAPIAGRGQDVRERLAQRSSLSPGGHVTRTHGDYHLGQTLYTPRGWVIIDFEGEPARPLPERRQKRSPLRDVASMLRSFAYATSAVEILRGRPAPDDFEERARQTFLEHYFEAVEPTLLPSGPAAVANLLSVFELEKAIYELQYEIDNRPDWITIPVAGIVRMLESE